MGTRKDQKHAARAQRRAEAWRLKVREFLTDDEIAGRLGVHRSTITRDLSMGIAEQDSKIEDLRRRYFRIHIAQLATLATEAYQAWERSKNPIRTITKVVDGDDEAERATVIYQEQVGNVAYLKELMNLMKQREALMGLTDERLRIDLSGTIAHAHQHDVYLPNDPDAQRHYIEELAGAALLLHGGDPPIDVSLPSTDDTDEEP